MTITDMATTRHDAILTSLRAMSDRWEWAGRAHLITALHRPPQPAVISSLAGSVGDQTAVTLLDTWIDKATRHPGIVEVQRDLGVDAVGIAYEHGDLLVIYAMDQHGDEYLVTRDRSAYEPSVRVGTGGLTAAGLPAHDFVDRIAELVWRLSGPLPTPHARIRAMWPEPGTIDLDDDALSARYAVPSSVARHVRLLMVSSLDGVAAVSGVSAPLSSTADQRMYHLIKAQADALLIGAGTVRAEQYGPTFLSPLVIAQRVARGQQPYPTVVVVSRSLQLDLDGPLFRPIAGHHTPPRPLILAPAAAVAEADPRLSEQADLVPAGDTDVELSVAIGLLADRGYRHVVCEGGPILAAQMLRDRLVDELCLTLAPLALATDGLRMAAGGASPVLDRWRIHESYLSDSGDLFLRYRQ